MLEYKLKHQGARGSLLHGRLMVISLSAPATVGRMDTPLGQSVSAAWLPCRCIGTKLGKGIDPAVLLQQLSAFHSLPEDIKSLCKAQACRCGDSDHYRSLLRSLLIPLPRPRRYDVLQMVKVGIPGTLT